MAGVGLINVFGVDSHPRTVYRKSATCSVLLTAAAGLGRTRGRDPRLCPSAVDPLVTAAGRGGPAPLQEALPVRKALGRPRPAGSSSPAPRVVIPVSTVQRETRLQQKWATWSGLNRQ